MCVVFHINNDDDNKELIDGKIFQIDFELQKKKNYFKTYELKIQMKMMIR